MAEPKRHVSAPAPVPGGIAARAMATRTASAPYLADLNPEQREAVETLDGPVLVLAGAGTGKTRVLTTRIAHILNLGRAHPREILSVTFTNKAAREMKERVGKMVGQIVEGMPWLGTFHAIGVKILRRHAEMVGLKSDFTILGVDDQIRLIKQLIEIEKLDEKRWRGAEVDNILRFDHDFPGAKVIRLERNYRSTGHILAAASTLIAHNEGRLGKTLRTEDVDGEKVQVTGAWDSEEEARAIGEEIEQMQRAARDEGQDHPLDEIAILVRASFQMREFEERFIQLGLSYRVIGGPRFYERAEIRDALAYLRVIAQPADDLAFERIVNVPKRGLGDATVQMLHDYARKMRVPLTEAARLLSSTDEMKPKPRTALRDLMANFERWRKQKDTLPHNELAEIVLDESGYTEMWQKDRSADAAGRLENLKELVRSMQEFENLAGFLEHISLVMDVDRGEAEQAVNIMTLHSAKGLEFDTVFLPGWEEGLFPHQRSLDESGRNGLEEERRLAHVGLTRARKRAKIYFASNRRIHGMWSTNIPSRFLDELPEAHVEVKEAAGGTGGFGMSGYGASRFDDAQSFGSTYNTPGWQRAQSRKGAGGFDVSGKARESRGGFSENGQPKYVPDGVFNQDDDSEAYSDNLSPRSSSPPPERGRSAGDAGRVGVNSQKRRPSAPLTIEGELVAKSSGTPSHFAVGERVFHLKFGNGNVTAVDGNKLTIRFDKAGEKRVVDSFVERV